RVRKAGDRQPGGGGPARRVGGARMSYCPTCGDDPCANPTFCAAARRTDANQTVARLQAEKAARETAKATPSKPADVEIFDAVELDQMQFEPVKFAVPGL